MRVTFAMHPLQAADLGGCNPLPTFRNPDPDMHVVVDPSMTPEEAEGIGRDCGKRVLPYLVQDRYDRDVRTRELPVVFIENEHLKATILAGYGGRLYSLFDKKKQREVLFCNPVIQPANLAIRDAWLSGGIEWNIGQHGHTFTTCSPVFCARLTDDEGQQFLRIYEYERQKRLFWQVDMHLPSGSRQLLCYTRIVNDHDASPMYWWTTTAVPEDAYTRVFASATRTMYRKGESQAMKDMPYFPELAPGDLSYPLKLTCSNDFFLQTPADVKAPWEAAVYKDGEVSFERSTALLRYRKVFCWGDLPGGWRWKEFLSKEGDGSYIEIQAGIARSQLHGITMPGATEWDFTMAIGTTDADPVKAHDTDWAAAQAYMADVVEQTVCEKQILKLHQRLIPLGKKAPEELLYNGSGWGALEVCRRQAAGEPAIPAGYSFPESTLTTEQAPWLTLLDTGRLTDHTPVSYITDEIWKAQLETAPDCWQKYYYLGVMEVEALRREAGIALLERSAALTETVWNLRALAVLAEDDDHAEALYDRVFTMNIPDVAFAQEYLSLLCRQKHYDKVRRVFDTLPEIYRQNDRVLLSAVQAQLDCEDTTLCDSGFFDRPFANVRECEVTLTDFWFRYQAILAARQQGVAVTPELEQQIRHTLVPPRHIDFRMR